MAWNSACALTLVNVNAVLKISVMDVVVMKMLLPFTVCLEWAR